jgi:glycosyltransferase involved in cell wall biosynthesis
MAAGLVPVVSDIPSGVPEVVESGKTGFMPAVGDVAGFAAAIAELHNNRDLLEAMSRAARAVVVESFNIRKQVLNYQALYTSYKELRRVRSAKHKLHYGSRLDKSWIPNTLVRALRSTIRSLR